jgi:hypothetical protein
MSRFKFACNCGKRLAAYDWMVGQIISCPKCGRTLTVPTPFAAEEKLAEMIEKGYTPTRRKIGVPVDRLARRRHVITVFAVIALVLAAVAAVYLFVL